MNTYQQIVLKSGLDNSHDAIELIDNFIKLYGTESPNEDMVERFIGMLGMLCPLPNYYQLHAEYCPNSAKNQPGFQEAVNRYTEHLRKALWRTLCKTL